MSTLMFWNKQNANANNNNETKNGKTKNWLHAPDALVNGHVAYLVKFLGSIDVNQAKGIDTVKDAIRRLQFLQEYKKNDSGNAAKMKKVEITVSVDGVAVQEPRTQTILHQFPLHNISYCADEKGVKKFFSFIAKTNKKQQNGETPNENGTNGSATESHECFVFISSKLASDITLTIGQAFELAYRRFMNDSGKTSDAGKLQMQNKQLESTVAAYRQRLKEMAEVLPKGDMDRLLMRLSLRDILEVPALENGIDGHMNSINGSKTPDLGIDVSAPANDDQLLIETSPKHFAPIVPPRNLQTQLNNKLEALKPSVGTKLEGLLLNSDSDSDFDPRADENDTMNVTNDFFGFDPPKSMGQQLFNGPLTNGSLTNGINGGSNGLNLMNGLNGMNGTASDLSPPPLLAPPPKAGIPRRSGNQFTNGSSMNSNGSQDLFGSTPFNPQPNAFDTTIGSEVYHHTSSFNDSTLDNSFASHNQSHCTGNESGVFCEPQSYPATTTPSTANLDGFFQNSIDNLSQQLKSSSGSHNFGTTATEKTNPFAAHRAVSPRLNEIKGFEAPQSNPFGSTNGCNYDALRQLTMTTNVTVAPQTSGISSDMFKDATSSMFGDLKKSGNEFSNILSLAPAHNSAVASNLNSTNFMAQNDIFGVGCQSTFKGVSFSADDFTLESLDPLRK